MSIILVRHGQTALNAARVMQPADTALSERGRAQALAVGRRLAATGAAPWPGPAPSGSSRRGHDRHGSVPGHRIAALMSSDLPRAWLTAEAIAASLGLSIEPSALLQERNFGALRGQPYDTLGFDPLVMQPAPPGGESASAFAQRVQSAFEQLLQRHARLDGDLVVVTHGLLIRSLLSGPLQQRAASLAGLHLENTSLTVFDAAPPFALSLLNCSSHLDNDLDRVAPTRSLSGG